MGSQLNNVWYQENILYIILLMLITTRKQLMRIAAWIKMGSQFHNVWYQKNILYILLVMLITTRKQLMRIADWIKMGTQFHNVLYQENILYVLSLMLITTRKQVMRIGQLGSKWGRNFTMFGKCLDFSFFNSSLMTSRHTW